MAKIWTDAVTAVVGIASRGPHRDRTWSEAYEAGKATEPAVTNACAAL